MKSVLHSPNLPLWYNFPWFDGSQFHFPMDFSHNFPHFPMDFSHDLSPISPFSHDFPPFSHRIFPDFSPYFPPVSVVPSAAGPRDLAGGGLPRRPGGRRLAAAPRRAGLVVAGGECRGGARRLDYGGGGGETRQQYVYIYIYRYNCIYLYIAVYIYIYNMY